MFRSRKIRLFVCLSPVLVSSLIAEGNNTPTPTPNSFAAYLEARTSKPSPAFQAFGYSMFAASGADVATTEWALRQPGVYEANPFMRNRGVRIATHALVPAAAWWTSRWMQQHGRRKAALFLRIGVTVAYGVLAVHNAHVASSRN